MKILRLNEDLNYTSPNSPDTRIMKKDTSYILPDVLVDQMVAEFSMNNIKVIKRHKNLYNEFDPYNGEDLSNRILAVIRYGGIGDLIFFTPIIRHLKNKYPTARFVLICNPTYKPLFSGLNLYDSILDYPTTIETIGEELKVPISKFNTYFVSLESMVETDPRAKKINIYDLHKAVFGLKEEIEYHPEIFLDLNRVEEAKKLVLGAGKAGSLNIGFQFTSSSPIRTWKPTFIRDFFNLWKIPNTRFFIFDNPAKIDFIAHHLSRVSNPNIEFIILPQHKTPMLDSIAIISQLTMMIVPDSSLSHIAGCLDIPQVALFGAFHTDLRLKYYKKVLGINAMPICKYASGEYKSCFTHGTNCAAAQEVNRSFSPCMDLLLPPQVASLTYGFLRKLGLISEVVYESTKHRAEAVKVQQSPTSK